MEFGRYVFGSIEVDGVTYEHDVVIEGGRIRKRKKGPSKALRGRYGHTPLTAAEEIPWSCRRLVIGCGASGSLPVTDDVTAEAERRGVDLVVIPTVKAIEQLRKSGADTNAILHVTCRRVDRPLHWVSWQTRRVATRSRVRLQSLER